MLPGFSYKRCAHIAFAAMAILALGAIRYYKERMIFTDASLVSFRRINLQDLESSQRRWGAFITECIPLLLSKLHVPLRALLIAYSLSFNLLYLAVAGLLIFRWRLYALGILMGAYYCFFVSAAYYWTNNEIHQAVAFLFLCIGWTTVLARRCANAVYQHSIFTILAGLAIFTHPLAIVAFGFLWGALWINSRDWPFSMRSSVAYAAVIVGWSVIKLLLSGHQPYDARRMYGLTHPELQTILHSFNGPVARQFYKACLINYWLVIICAFAGWCLMLRQRKWLISAWMAGSAFVFLVLLHCGFPQGHFLYYLEGEWQTMGIIAAFPVVYYLLPALKPAPAATLVAALFAVRLLYIRQSAQPFTERIAFIESLLHAARRQDQNKVLIRASDSRFEDRLYLDWGLATESMTLSALDGEYPQRTLCAYWPDHPERIPNGNQEMVWNFDKRPAAALNRFYFSLDTTHPYVIVPFEKMER